MCLPHTTIYQNARAFSAQPWNQVDPKLTNMNAYGTIYSVANIAQLVEQLFRKQQVKGSSPFVGSKVECGFCVVQDPRFLCPATDCATDE